MEKKELIKSIDNVLIKNSYKRKSTTWYLSKSDFVCVLNLQKSAWGNQYYMNVSVCFKKGLDIEYPRENQCDIRWRLGDESANVKNFAKILDFEDTSIPTEDKLKIINKVITDTVIPLFSSLNTREDLIKFIKSNPKNLIVTVDGKKILGIPV